MKRVFFSQSDLSNKFASLLPFLEFTRKWIPPLAMATLLVLLTGLFFVFYAPHDYQQGVAVKIMFLHVPFAWMALLYYLITSCFALFILLYRHPLMILGLKASAPLGAVSTILALITGSLWGYPIWGTWWEWDARLTSMLILFLIYCSIILLSRSFQNEATAATAAAIFTLIGLINIPIIQFSVVWWHSLHQPSSFFRKDGIAIDSQFLLPLLIMTVCAFLIFLLFQLMAMRNLILRQLLLLRQQHRIHQQKPRAP